MRGRSAGFLVIVGLVVPAWVCCNPAKFDDLAKKAPVQVRETPSDLQKFRPAVLWVQEAGGGSQGPEGTLVAAGAGEVPLVAFPVQADGTLGRKTLDSEGGLLAKGEVKALASIAPGACPSDQEGLPGLLVGIPGDEGGVSLVLAEPDGSLDPCEAWWQTHASVSRDDCSMGGDDFFGQALVAADLSGDGSPFGVVGGKGGFCLLDFEAQQALGPCGSDSVAAMAAGRFLPRDLGIHGDSVAVAGSGSVSVVGFRSLDAGFGSGDCADASALEVPVPGTGGAFGSAMAVAHCGQGDLDLLVVGAPETRGGAVFVYQYSEGDGGFVQQAEIQYPANWKGPEGVHLDVSNFGGSVLVDDLDGDGELDLAVSAPDSAVGGHEGSGVVFVYLGGPCGRWDGTPWALWDWEPGRASRLGLALATVPWKDGKKALAVISDNAVYLFQDVQFGQ